MSSTIDVFEYAFRKLIDVEGKYSDHPADKGGKTKWGITEAEYKRIKDTYQINAETIKELTKEEARLIYLLEYWIKIHGDEIKSPYIATEIFDTAVNMGINTAIIICQRALNYLGEKLKEDGILGPLTLTALNWWCQKDKQALFLCLNGFQFMHYVAIIMRDPSQSVFARGWTKRIQQYREDNNVEEQEKEKKNSEEKSAKE